MGRDDDPADPLRRASVSSGSGGGGGGPRAKRHPTAATTAPSGSLQYDPTMGTHAYAASASPSHEYAAYAPSGDRLQYSGAYTNDSVAPGSASNKRKRVKKERDEDYAVAPPPPPPPPPPSTVYANEVSMHTGMPTILHRSSSATVAVAPQPPPTAPFQAVYETQPAHTIFSEVPAAIESFAETERRRKNAATAAGIANINSGAAEMSQRINSNEVSAAPKASNGASSWNSRSIASGTMSVYDVFYPSLSRSKEVGDTSRNGTPGSKRRRRNANGETTERGSTRTSNRRAASSNDGNLEVDMLKFAVDSFNLIPQGLVDRIDPRLRPEEIKALIANHVDNWIKRAGFDDQIFLQEITTLLNAYYPCTYPTILDEVLPAFVFKRPELMDRMITSIVEQLLKTGESASPSKYPVIESFARRCGLPTRGEVLRRDQARHDLACLTVLRLLLERNTEKFMLSPWIASCASFCSDDVIAGLWDALLRSLLNSGKTKLGDWNVCDPLGQVFELLREENPNSRHAEREGCRLSMALIKRLTQDSAYQHLRREQIACEAFEIVFGRSASSAQLIKEWIQSEKSCGHSHDAAVRKVINAIVGNCVRLSVKKTNWFVKHLLTFAMTENPSQSILSDLLVEQAGLLLGGVDKNEIEELHDVEPLYFGSNSSASADKTTKSTVVGRISNNEKHTEAGVVEQMDSFLNSLRSIPGESGADVVRAWSKTWCGSHVLVPWSYVWAIVSAALRKRSNDGSVAGQVDVAFLEFAGRFVRHYVQDLLHRKDPVRYLVRIVRIVHAASRRMSEKSASVIVESILEAVAILPMNSPVADKAHSAIGTTLAEQVSTRSAGQAGVAEDTQNSSTPKSRGESWLVGLCKLTARTDIIGKYVRDHLFQRRRMDKMILQILRDGDEADVRAAVYVMTNYVCRSDSKLNSSQQLWTSSVIETVVAAGYRVHLSDTRRDVIALLNGICISHTACAKSMVWALLKSCTRQCCGCLTRSNATPAVPEGLEVAAAFADLTKLVLKRQGHQSVTEVGGYIQQHIATCGAQPGRWNSYLALVLDRIVQLGWSFMASTPRVIHMVLSPFGFAHPRGITEGGVVQLRILKSLCLVTLADASSRQDQDHCAPWTAAVHVLVSDELQSKLNVIGAQTGCATSTVLVQSISILCEDIKQIVETRCLPSRTIQPNLSA